MKRKQDGLRGKANKLSRATVVGVELRLQGWILFIPITSSFKRSIEVSLEGHWVCGRRWRGKLHGTVVSSIQHMTNGVGRQPAVAELELESQI